MDLGFAPLSPADATPLSAVGEACLMAGAVPAGADEHAVPAVPLAPADGAFSGAMAARLDQWRRE